MKCIICGKEIEKSSYYHKVICSSECFGIDFWNDWVEKKDDPRVARIDGTHYYIGNENEKGSFRGFGGRKFKIRFNDGREVITTNLWHQGEISNDFKEKLPDNAVFVTLTKEDINGTK